MSVSMGLRAASFFFTVLPFVNADDGVVDFEGKFDNLLKKANRISDVERVSLGLKEVLTAIDWVLYRKSGLDAEKQVITLFVDEAAKTKNIPGVYGALRNVLDSTLWRTDVGPPVACFVSGLSIVDWEKAGFASWQKALSDSDLDLEWGCCDTADDAALGEFINRLEDLFVDKTELESDEEKRRFRNMASIVASLSNGHWRTIQKLLDGLERWNLVRGFLKSQDWERQLYQKCLEIGRQYWGQLYLKGVHVEGSEALAFMLADSARGATLNPDDVLPVNARDTQDKDKQEMGVKSVAFWRSVCAEMSPVLDKPASAKDIVFSPLFSLFQVFDWAAQFDERPSLRRGINGAVLALARHCKALLGSDTLQQEALWQRWEFELAHGLRLSFIANYLSRVHAWRLREEDETNSWPGPDKLDDIIPTIPLVSYDDTAFLKGFNVVGPLSSSNLRLPDECVGDLWNSRNNALTKDAKQRKFFDEPASRTLPLKPGDVLVPGTGNPGFDVVAPVTFTNADGTNERPGLIVVQATSAAKLAEAHRLDEDKLKDTAQTLREGYDVSGGHRDYRGVLWAYGDDDAFETSIEWLRGHSVMEKDVLLVMAGHCECDLRDDKVQELLRDVDFSVAYAGIGSIADFFGTSLAGPARAPPSRVSSWLHELKIVPSRIK